MERIVSTRMTWDLEKNNILIEEQAGLRRGRCIEDHITLIAQDIENGFQEKRHTVAVWIDMEKAFDRVWRDRLSLKLMARLYVQTCLIAFRDTWLANRM
ncbi:RNA-directed DNA polymerase from [Elysia marginata]|uniref:RNA-directed DNA polymerase from n=1 Tax=Elysia marginata TaxID=1093978 RepID=A0AAV4EJI2_9GAST|nr:RNA-directed DNA polymerase from [Elysia marginata]